MGRYSGGMHAEPFHIVTDRTRGLVTLTFESVFWTAETAKHFVKAIITAVMSLERPAADILILVDLRNAVLQSRDVYEKMIAFVGASPDIRIALVASAPIARMQTKRLQFRDGVMMFGDMAEAEAWLFADQRAAA